MWRIMAADMAARAELSFDRYNDLELAVTEAFGALLAGEPTSVELTLEPIDGRVVAMATPHGSARLPELDELTMIVLGTVTDAMTTDATTGSIRLEVAAG